MATRRNGRSCQQSGQPCYDPRQMKKTITFTCQNQSCGARWKSDEISIVNEGQGPLFRCPICNSRNRLVTRVEPDGTTVYRQRRNGPG